MRKTCTIWPNFSAAILYNELNLASNPCHVTFLTTRNTNPYLRSILVQFNVSDVSFHIRHTVKRVHQDTFIVVRHVNLPYTIHYSLSSCLFIVFRFRFCMENLLHPSLPTYAVWPSFVQTYRTTVF